MKTSKSPVNTEVTPSKKKLKQARLPFMLISDVSPKPAEQQPRKRKLSTPQPEPVTKIGKLSKENDLTDELVVISDDESKNEEVPKVERQMNPFVKLVDNAWKKKQQKSRKKKKPSKKKVTHTTVTNSLDSECDEKMDVDMPSENKEVPVSDRGAKKDLPTKESINTSKETVKENETSKNEKIENISEIVDLDASNDSSVQSMVDNKTVIKETEEKAVIIDENNIEINENDTESLTKVSDSDEKDIETSKCADKSDESDSGNNDIVDSDKEEQNTNPIQKNNESETSIVNKLTPKRIGAPTKSRLDAKNDSNTPTKVNESVSSTVSTPKHSRSSSATNSQGNDSMNDSTANLTPRQLQKKLESAKKKEERDKEKQEREKKKQQEKEERAKQRLEKEEQRKKEREEKEEAKKKEKEEKEEHKRKEREEKEKQKELERKLKEEKEDQKRKEREEKEEQKKKEKEAKEEEKRKKQEAIELEKQEQELKKKKAAEAFVNFFVPKQKVDKDPVSDGPVSKNSMLSSFTIKGDMRLAPTVRVDLTEEKRQGLDNLMEQQNIEFEELYLKNLKDGTIKPMSSGKTWPMDDKDDDDDDVMIIEDELPLTGAGEIVTCEPAVREKLHPKLLSFHENRRPPYWGTWRKKSAFVKPRKPFGQDEKQLDYEVDSDDDWEEEQEGESIDGSAAGSDDEQDADEYEVDNEVFVPHGYLSDEEATMGEDDVVSFSPETQKARLKDLEDEFESEMKKPTEKIKPRLYGLLWENSDGGKPEHCVDALWNYFGKLAMIMNDPTPLLELSKEPEEAEKKKVKKKKAPKKEGEEQTESPKVEKKKKSKADKESKTDTKKSIPDVKKNQPGINSFLTKLNQNK